MTELARSRTGEVAGFEMAGDSSSGVILGRFSPCSTSLLRSPSRSLSLSQRSRSFSFDDLLRPGGFGEWSMEGP